MTIKQLRMAGWKFSYDRNTRFIGAEHPLGGKFSVMRVEVMERNGFDLHEFGQAVAGFLQAGGEASITSWDGPVDVRADLANARRIADENMGLENDGATQDPLNMQCVRCSTCGKQVSQYINVQGEPAPLLVRAFVSCPECLELESK